MFLKNFQVESAEDIQRRNERRAKRKSRWDNSGSTSAKASKVTSTALVPLGAPPSSGGVKDNAALWAQRSQMGQMLQPTMDVLKMDDTAQKIYLLKMQIQEACLKLGQPNLGIPPNPRDRSPSPEPIYNNKGVRINTRIDRTRNKLVTMRNNAITRLKELDPTYQPPSVFNYKNAELEDRVNIPAEVQCDGLSLAERFSETPIIRHAHHYYNNDFKLSSWNFVCVS